MMGFSQRVKGESMPINRNTINEDTKRQSVSTSKASPKSPLITVEKEPGDNTLNLL